MENNIGFNIGTEKETVAVIRDSILSIINTGVQPAEQDTVKLGLAIFKELSQVENASLSNCTVTMLPHEGERDFKISRHNSTDHPDLRV